MQIDVITDPAKLDEIRENWDRVYDEDPEAQFFLSWTWLSRHLRLYDGTWFVLAAREGGPGTPYAGFMPLRLRIRMDTQTGQFSNEINMAGNYAADYTGAICMPTSALQAMQAFARHVRDMAWTNIHLENVRMSDERLLAFLGQFPRETLALREYSRINTDDNVNNCRCFAASLPDSFASYLDNVLSTNTRQKLRRFLRKVDAGELRITHANAETLDHDIDMMLDFWRIRWGARKGNRLQSIIRHNKVVLQTSFETGSLFMPLLWQGDRPLGALASFIDPVKQQMLFYISGRDETATSIPVGLILHGHSIQSAIERGIGTYDFLRGDEPYKFAFGVTESKIRCAIIYTKDGLNVGNRLDPRSLDGIFAQVTRFHREGQLARAESGYRQILGTDPLHETALYGLGQLVSDKGDHREAHRLFETLATIAPNSAKVWFRLGFAAQALDDHAGAAEAFRRSLELDTHFAGAKFSLAKSLAELDRSEDAIGMLEALEHELEAEPRGETLLAKTKALLTRLKRETRPSYIMLNPQPKAARQLVGAL